LDTFYCWIKLRLPDEVFENLTLDCQNIIPLMFNELSSESNDNVEVAANCMVELLSISKNDEKFQPIKNLIVQNVESILGCASVAISNSDAERAEQYSRIFSAIASSHISQIIATG
jgi:hypothetical protein